MAIQIERRVTGSGSWNVLTNDAENPYIDDTAVGGVEYDYRAKIVEGEAESPYSDIKSVITMEAETIPDTPTGLIAEAVSSSQINLSWNASTGATSYKIEKRVGSGSWNVLEAAHIGTSYVDTGLIPETEYSYRVSATNSAGTSSASPAVTETTLEEGAEDNPPATPSNLTATVISANQINLAWDSVPGATSYTVQKKVGTGEWWTPTTSLTSNSFSDVDITPSTEYIYRVVAKNEFGSSSPTGNTIATTPAGAAPKYNREYDFTYPSPAQSVALGAAYVYVPEAYRNNPREKFPVLIYCHGQNEKAGGTTPNFEKLASGSGFTNYLRGNTRELPCIIICPQVVGWGAFSTEGVIDELIEAVCSDLLVELSPESFVLSGWSLGGNDTWQYARNHDNVRIKGYVPFGCRLNMPSNNTQTQEYINKGLPTWIFHNYEDPTQDVMPHIGFLSRVKTLDPDNDFIRGTIYQGGGHDSVTKTINGNGGDVMEGYYPYKDAGNEFYDWVAECCLNEE